jgi:Isopentenyl transferase
LAAQVNVKRVMIVGPGAAGKSTFAVRLAEITGLPVIELDQLFWRPGRAGRLLMGAARAELDPGQDANGCHEQPGREQDMHGKAEDGQGHDGNEDEGDDREHGDRSPFMSHTGADGLRLPLPVAHVDRDQPWFVPEVHPGWHQGEP